MSAFAKLRGHEITSTGSTTDMNDWRYTDTGEPVLDAADPRPCLHCGLMPIPMPDTRTGYGADACLGRLPGVIAACCGHGDGPATVLFDDGTGLEGDEARLWQELMRNRLGLVKA